MTILQAKLSSVFPATSMSQSKFSTRKIMDVFVN